MWARRYDDFPGVALETGSPVRPTKYLVRREFWAFVRTRGLGRLAPSDWETSPEQRSDPPAPAASGTPASELQRRIGLLTEERRLCALRLIQAHAALRAAQLELRLKQQSER